MGFRVQYDYQRSTFQINTCWEERKEAEWADREGEV